LDVSTHASSLHSHYALSSSRSADIQKHRPEIVSYINVVLHQLCINELEVDHDSDLK